MGLFSRPGVTDKMMMMTKHTEVKTIICSLTKSPNWKDTTISVIASVYFVLFRFVLFCYLDVLCRARLDINMTTKEVVTTNTMINPQNMNGKLYNRCHCVILGSYSDGVHSGPQSL